MLISKAESNLLKGFSIFCILLTHILGNYFNINEYIRNILGTGGVCIFFVFIWLWSFYVL